MKVDTPQPNPVESKDFTDRQYDIEDDHEAQFASAMAQKAADLLENQNFKAAEKCLRIGLQHCPDHTECQAYIAICVAQGRDDLEKAKKIARRIIQNNPDSARAHYALGRINLMADRRGKAFHSFRKSQSLAGKDQILNEDLGKMEPRKSPILPFLDRKHPVNHMLGWLRARLFSRN